MIIPKYKQELYKIKVRLNRYSHASAFNAALNYLGQKSSKKPVEKMPWVVMFLLKHKLLQGDGSEIMSERNFLTLANRVFKLGDLVAEHVSPEVSMLVLRAMLVQQQSYQIQSIDYFRYLLLSRELLNKSYVVNNDLFKGKTGIALNDYFKIAVYLFVQAGSASPNSVIRYNMSSFYSHLSPTLSDETITQFLKLVGLPFGQFPEYLKAFEVRDSNAAELYQETPFKNKPIIIREGELIIFNAGLCVLGLCSIVIEILKSDKDFTRQFGDDVEAYIGERLRMTSSDVYSMPELNNIIPIKIGQIADYVVAGNGG